MLTHRAEGADRKGSQQRLEKMADFLKEQETRVEEYDEQLIRSLLGEIMVFEDKFTVEFKSGVEVDVEM